MRFLFALVFVPAFAFSHDRWPLESGLCCAWRGKSCGVVQGSHLGLEIDDSAFRSVQDTFRRSKVCSSNYCEYGVFSTSEVFYTLFASRLFSRPCATPYVRNGLLRSSPDSASPLLSFRVVGRLGHRAPWHGTRSSELLVFLSRGPRTSVALQCSSLGLGIDVSISGSVEDTLGHSDVS